MTALPRLVRRYCPQKAPVQTSIAHASSSLHLGTRAFISNSPLCSLLSSRSSRSASVPSVLANMPPRPKRKADTEATSDLWRLFQQDFETLAERHGEKSEPSVSAELAAHGYAKLTFQG